jgi:fructose-1,6-bisphosphatase/inositol monophosphatase family enzyme
MFYALLRDKDYDMPIESIIPGLDLAAVDRTIRDVAATYVRPRFQMLNTADKWFKNEEATDIVTVADIEAEHAFEARLPALLKDSIVIGEESVSRGDNSIDTLQRKDVPVWVVDPVDGTWNFSQGNPTFCMMVALQVNGERAAGFIYDVVNDTMTMAVKGGGAWREGERLHTAQTPADMREWVGHLPGVSDFRIKNRQQTQAFRDAFDTAQSLTYLRCSGHEYLRIADGRSHFTVGVFPKPWDHMAGSLIVEEAGGCAAHWNAAPYDPAQTKAGILTTCRPDMWRDVHTAFIGSHRPETPAADQDSGSHLGAPAARA